MKIIILTALTLLSSLAYTKALEDAHEVVVTQVEFREISQEGVVRIKNCNNCAHSIYVFSSELKVIKNNLPSSIQSLVIDYLDAKISTLFIKPGTNELIRISYRK